MWNMEPLTTIGECEFKSHELCKAAREPGDKAKDMFTQKRFGENANFCCVFTPVFMLFTQ